MFSFVIPVIDTDALIANGTMRETDMQVKIAKLATSLAHTLYQRVVGGPYTGDLKVSAHLVRTFSNFLYHHHLRH